MDTRNRVTVSSAWLLWVVLQAGALAAEMPVAPGTDARYYLQDNREHIQEQLDALRLRQLQREEEVSQKPAPALQPGSETCLPVSGLRLAGVTLLQPGDLVQLRQVRDACLTGAHLNRIIHQLTALYLARGYIAARVVPEMPRDGVMTLRVFEGRVDRIEGAGCAADWLFPGMVGAPLNLRDLEQGLDQANRLQSQQLRAEVAPGRQQGETTVRLVGESASPWLRSLVLDNRGYDATGRNVLELNLSRDNPTGHYDFLNVALEYSPGHGRYSRRASVFYSLPYGHWTASAFAGASAYLNTQKLLYHTVELTGTSGQYGLRLDRVLARNQTHIISGHLQLSHKQVRNFFLGSLQSISSPTLTVAELGADRLSLHRGGALTLEARLEQGVPWLGAQRDWKTAGRGLPRAQFLKAGLAAGLRQGLPAGRRQLVLDSRLTWQTSRDRLPAIEQIELADNNLVRGFRHNSLSGERGGVWHNTLSTRLRAGSLSLTPRLAVDLGRVRTAGIGWRTLAGGGLGLEMRRGRLALDLKYNRPLRSPAGLAGEPHQLLARFTLQL